MSIDDFQILEMEKTRCRILEDLVKEKLSSIRLVTDGTTKKGNSKKNDDMNIVLPRIDIKRGKLFEIVKIIIGYSDFGINHGDLADKLGMDRKYLRTFTKLLIKEKIIWREKKQDGAYKISPIFSIFDNTYNMKNNDFREMLVELLSEYEPLLLVSTKIKNINLAEKEALRRIVNLIRQKDEYTLKKMREIQRDDDRAAFEYFLKKRSKGINEESTLFEFSNTIGFIFIYLCLFAMDPKNNITKYGQNDKEKDMLVMLWIYDIVSKFCLEWLQQFTLKIPHALKSLSSLDTTEYDKKIESLKPHKRKTKYIYDSVIIEELQKTLKKTYPYLFRICEVIFNEEPKIKSLHQQKEKLVKSCKHDDIQLDKNYIIYDKLLYESNNELFKSHDELIFDLDMVKFVKHCQRCHRNVYSKK